jgi:hypothetical protein
MMGLFIECQQVVGDLRVHFNRQYRISTRTLIAERPSANGLGAFKARLSDMNSVAFNRQSHDLKLICFMEGQSGAANKS